MTNLKKSLEQTLRQHGELTELSLSEEEKQQITANLGAYTCELHLCIDFRTIMELINTKITDVDPPEAKYYM